MEEILLRGYVTPEDFEGSDTQRLQKALQMAMEWDLRKVVLEGEYVAEQPIELPAPLHLEILPGAKLTAQLHTPIEKNYSFAKQWLCLNGGGILEGDLQLFNCAHVTLENLTVTGKVSLEFCRWIRMEDVETSLLQLGKGCSEGIFQSLNGQVLLDTRSGCGTAVMGVDPKVRSLILRKLECAANVPALTLYAQKGIGFCNILAEDITAPETAAYVGDPLQPNDPRDYFNLSLKRLHAPTRLCTRVPLMNGYVKDDG